MKAETLVRRRSCRSDRGYGPCLVSGGEKATWCCPLVDERLDHAPSTSRLLSRSPFSSSMNHTGV